MADSKIKEAYPMSLGSAAYQVFKGTKNGFIFGAMLRFPMKFWIGLTLKKYGPAKLVTSSVRGALEYGAALSLFVTVFKALKILVANLRKTNDSMNGTIAGGLTGMLIARQKPDAIIDAIMYVWQFALEGLGRYVFLEKEYLPASNGLFQLFVVLGYSLLFFLYETNPSNPPFRRSFAGSLKFLYQ